MVVKKKKKTQSRPVQRAKERDELVGPMDDVTPIIEFLESFRDLTDPRAKQALKLISIKIPEQLLTAFRYKAERQGVPYQTMIKKLMMEWLRK